MVPASGRGAGTFTTRFTIISLAVYFERDLFPFTYDISNLI